MKIICIGRNYAKHAKELNNPVPAEPVFFMKPETSLILNGKPFFHPDFSKNIHFETELVLRINRLGKNIEERFAHRYYNEIGIGIDFTARDIQDACKKKGLPWEKAKAFDGSAPLGEFIPKSTFKSVDDINFSLNINGVEKQRGNTQDLLFCFDKIIAHVSKYLTLKIGDLIYTGTPEGVGPVKVNDKLEAFIEGERMLTFQVK